jgi:hypothetical protein
MQGDSLHSRPPHSVRCCWVRSAKRACGTIKDDDGTALPSSSAASTAKVPRAVRDALLAFAGRITIFAKCSTAIIPRARTIQLAA